LIQKEQGRIAPTVFPVAAPWKGRVSKAVLTRITGWFAR
jgi:hypothetical protein